MELKEQMKSEWLALSQTWIEGTSSGRNEHRDGLLDPWIVEAAGDVRGLQVIDLGCGEGRYSRMLASRGAKVTGVDLCEPFVLYCNLKRFSDEVYAVGDVERLDRFADGRFDLALSVLNLVDLLDYSSSVVEAYRVLKPGGRFVVCNLQPAFTAGKDDFKLDNYFEEGQRRVPIFDRVVTNFHRTLSSYMNTFLNAGFILEGLREPKPTREQIAQYPAVADNLRFPYFIIYLLRKPTKP